uniref:probable protein ABIL5 n=1 Tax=Erigeron canadensis TaxID=72917 RepID=UPI001CB8E904|nr:probable protein ABIL5 [Erigeron canadensis]
MEEDSNSSHNSEHSEIEPQSYSKFSNSIKELKDLCSQLHAAAGYCESTFMSSSHKHLVVENTKEYVCKAVVAVVDHLGSVSANLDYHISKTDTETICITQVKIDSLKQKLFTCQEYSDKLAQAKLTWKADTPRYNSRYLKSPGSDVLNLNKQHSRDAGSEIVVNNVNNTKLEFKIDEDIPLLFYTCISKLPSLSQSEESTSEKGEKTINSSSSAIPVRDNLSIQSKPQALSFQLQDKRKSKRGTLFRKSMTSNEILSIIRRRR